jgi:CDP-diacylglycerol--serine O-phosphatidyltransferase
VLLLLNMAANAKELRQLTLALPLILILVSFLMVSTVRYPSFKQVNWETKTRYRTFVVVFIGIVLIVRLQEVALFFLFLGYITYGLFAHFQRGVRHSQMRVLRRKVVKMKQEDSE